MEERIYNRRNFLKNAAGVISLAGIGVGLATAILLKIGKKDNQGYTFYSSMDDVMVYPYKYRGEMVCLEGCTNSAHYQPRKDSDRFSFFLYETSGKPGLFFFQFDVPKNKSEDIRKLQQIVYDINITQVRRGNKIKIRGQIKDNSSIPLEAHSLELDGEIIDIR